MDHLPSDLVDHLLHFLPLTDLETIKEEAADRPELHNWKAMAEVHLEERFFLGIEIVLAATKDQQEAQDDNTQLYVSCVFYRGKVKEIWDFKKWRYAWISSIHLGSWFSPSLREHYTAVDLQKVLQIASLPVDGTDGRLDIRVISSSVAHVAQKILNVVQKTFGEVYNCAHDKTIENFLVDYLSQEKFLTYSNTDVVCADTAKAFVEKWMNSNMSLDMHLSALYDDISGELMDAFGTEDGVLAHPSRPCSLRIDEMDVEEHEHEDAARVESGIVDKWKKGNGYLSMYSESKIAILGSEDEWEKLVEKYGLSNSDDDSAVITIAHPSCTGKLFLRKEGRCLCCSVSFETEGSDEDFKALIAHWTKGDGKYLANGKKQMEFLLDTENWIGRFPDWLEWAMFREIEYDFVAHSNRGIGLKINKVFSDRYATGVLFRLSVIGMYSGMASD